MIFASESKEKELLKNPIGEAAFFLEKKFRNRSFSQQSTFFSMSGIIRVGVGGWVMEPKSLIKCLDLASFPFFLW